MDVTLLHILIGLVRDTVGWNKHGGMPPLPYLIHIECNQERGRMGVGKSNISYGLSTLCPFTFPCPLYDSAPSKMRSSLILSLIVGSIAVYAVTPPVSDQLKMGEVSKRQCNTGKYCCPAPVQVRTPEPYCVKYCSRGSPYIQCPRSYVSRNTCETFIIVLICL